MNLGAFGFEYDIVCSDNSSRLLSAWTYAQMLVHHALNIHSKHSTTFAVLNQMKHATNPSLHNTTVNNKDSHQHGLVACTCI